jgi:hypothetical protein
MVLIIVVLMFCNDYQQKLRHTLSHIGLCLRNFIFMHDQLYVVVSRVKMRNNLKILMIDDDNYLSKLLSHFKIQIFINKDNVIS